MATRISPLRLTTFAGRLGRFAVVLREDRRIVRVGFGYKSQVEAVRAIESEWERGDLLRLSCADPARVSLVIQPPEPWLVEPFQKYAEGIPVDFHSFEIDTGSFTPFRRRVVEACRQIPYGQTKTYGQLAAEVGSPRAARAVGQVMAANPTLLVVPCHRVVAAGTHLGGFSAPGGISLKQKLLTLEAS